MLRNLVVLPDGTEILTGKYAIKTAQYTSVSNRGNDLEPGSVCSDMLEVTFFSPDNSLAISEGTEVIYYKVNDAGYREKVGLFTLEKPQIPSKNSFRFTAYDRISWLDKDMTDWLHNLTEWPYTLDVFARMVCGECGLTLANTSIPNGDFMVQKFYDRCTARQIMQWVAQICGRFCKATPDGDLELAWYKDSGITINPDGDVFYFSGSLSYSDFNVAPVDKIVIQLSDLDAGVAFPDDIQGENIYFIGNNHLLAGATPEEQSAVAESLLGVLRSASYTPCRVSVPAGTSLRAGDIVSVVDRNGRSFSTYVMKKIQKGQRDTIECTGSAKRASPTALNNEILKDIAGKTFRIQKSVDVLLTRAEDLEGRFSEFEQTAGGISIEVGSEKGTLATYITAATEEEPAKWEAKFTDTEGNVRSGFYFDFDEGQFRFDGSGQFWSQDRNSYIMMDGEEMVLYRKKANGLFVQTLRMGASALTDENSDNSYILMGVGTASSGGLGLMKRFNNGLWFGNSYPIRDTGIFTPQPSYTGIFVDVWDGKTYSVTKGVMTQIYAGISTARFG